jgi:peptidoglycan/xylan/chitin deacetylase (PgdA/CDA1 family)
MRILRRLAVAVISIALIAWSFYFFYMRPRYTVPVLMYHSIASNPSDSLSVTPENFRKQMEYLQTAGYSVISLDELIDAISSGKRSPGKEVVLTFDDGLEDNYIKAFPVLSGYDMPAIIFLESANIDNRGMYLTWGQIRHMVKNNIAFGAHTRTGAYLPSISQDQVLVSEIVLSKSDIEEEIGKKVKYFCYPTGGFNDRIKEIVRIAGYKGACTTNRGFDRFNTDIYEINRIKVTDSDMTKPFNFQAKLSGYYNLFRKGKSPD